MYKIYCDGACSGNPGKGSWAYVVFYGDKQIFSASGYEPSTTNNRMELLAAINALRSFDNCEVILDSKYVKDGITTWIHKWKVNGWKSSSGLIKNRDLWEILDLLASKRKIIWSWSKGHAGSFHDFADELARNSILS